MQLGSQQDILPGCGGTGRRRLRRLSHPRPLLSASGDGQLRRWVLISVGRPDHTFVPAGQRRRFHPVMAPCGDAQPREAFIACSGEENAKPVHPSPGRVCLAHRPPRRPGTTGHPRRAGPRVGTVVERQPRPRRPPRPADLDPFPGRTPVDRQSPAPPRRHQRRERAMTRVQLGP